MPPVSNRDVRKIFSVNNLVAQAQGAIEDVGVVKRTTQMRPHYVSREAGRG